MDRHPSLLPLLLKELRQATRASAQVSQAALQPVVDQAFTLLGHEDPSRPETDIHASDLASTLAVMLDVTRDPSFIRYALARLAAMGGFGEILVLSYLHKGIVPPEKAPALLSDIPGRTRLFLANVFFLNPAPREPRLLQWAFDIARSLQADDPEEVMLFLEALDARGERLAYPLQRELMRSRFGVWLSRLIRLGLNEEQFAYMLRIVGRMESRALVAELAKHAREASARDLAALFTLVGRFGKKGDAKLIEAAASGLEHADERVKLAAALALLRLDAAKGVGALLALRATQPEDRPEIRLALLDASKEAWRDFFSRLTPKERLEELLAQTALLAAADNEWILDAIAVLAAGNEPGHDFGPEAAAWAAAYATARARPPARPLYWPSPPEETPAEDDDESGTGRPGLFDHLRRLLEPLRGETPARSDKETDKGPDFFQALSLAKGAKTLRDQTLSDASLPGTEVCGMLLANLTLRHVDLSGSVFEDTRFVKCNLLGVDFSGGELRNVSFEHCELARTDFSKTACSQLFFRSCVGLGLSMRQARVERLLFDDCLLRESDFSGAALNDLTLTGTRLDAAHFAWTILSRTRIDGVDMTDCRFAMAFLDELSARNASFAAVVFTDCRVLSLDSDEPETLFAEHAYRGRVMEDAVGVPAGAPEQLGQAGAKTARLLFALLRRWQAEAQARLCRRSLLANNRRRLDWALCMLGNPGADFLRLLPALIELPANLADPGRPAPACAISGYAPDQTTKKLLAKHRLPARPEGASATPLPPSLPIDALYSIGSTGTIAQARSSDMDLWVCYDPNLVTPGQAKALSEKLAGLEQWAAVAFGLEAHFFLMDLEKTRQNDFGYSDSESAGSTQALLLKEEFYRTAVLLAGKIPAWWLFPPGESEADCRRGLGDLARSDSFGPDRVADLGFLETIPDREFFGASLWQIVKAMQSPFKSVMKLALLDAYMGGAGLSRTTLLCDRIKERLLAGERDLWRIDPYAVLFAEIFERYRQSERKDAQDLMRLAFVQKTGMALSSQPTGRSSEFSGYSYMEYFFPYSESRLAAHIEPRAGAAADKTAPAGGFAQRVQLGGRIAAFMLETYTAILNRLSADPSAQAIRQEDLTKLGRKVLAYLRPRPNKILPVPFMDSPRGLFATLEIACQGQPGATTWIARGEPTQREGRGQGLEEVRRDQCLERLLAWCVANEIYAPNLHLQAGALEAPVSQPDILDLLKRLAALFPAKKLFSPPLRQFLEPARVQRALVVVNLTAQRERKDIARAACIHASTWGELFCIPLAPEPQTLRDQPGAFVSRASGLPLAPDARIEVFLPHRSLCPPISVL